MLKEKLKMMNGVLENGNYQLGQFKFANFPFERGEILFSKGFFDFRIFVNYKTKLKLHIL